MHYDYIIVGAGSAGCVLAHRLSADPACRVLLLEAGGSDRRRAVAIPAAFPKLFRTSRDWALESEPDPTLGGRRLYLPRGRMLGGSSSMNATIYVRGNRRDFDGWRDGGCPGWGYLDVLPYFKRSESQERGPSRFHGEGGPLAVSDARSVTPLTRAFLDAAVAWGLAENPDFNGARQTGVGVFQVTQRAGRRASSAAAFLRPALRRPNLRVETRARALRLFVEQGRVFGVEFSRGGRAEYAFSRGEIVLAAGAFGSPQLLLLSGIGPVDELERHDIAVQAELPGVGANLHDHLVILASWHALPGYGLESAQSLRALLRFQMEGRGPLTSSIAEAGAFLRLDRGSRAPDCQLHFVPAFCVEHGFRNPEGSGLSIGATLLAPESRGRLSLRSADPAAPPRVQGRYLASDRDLATLVEGLRVSREIADRPALRRFCRVEHLPGAKLTSQEELERYVRKNVETVYHPAGSCRMGQGDEAVVDARLRVRGVEGLRVADASIMPALPRGNPNAATIMIAEKAAAMILADA